MEISPSVSFRDLLETSVQATQSSRPPTAEGPEPSSGLEEKEPMLSQEQSGLGRTVEENSPIGVGIFGGGVRILFS